MESWTYEDETLDSWRDDWEKNELRPVEKERDMLLAALEDALSMLDWLAVGNSTAMKAARAAIAKAKGGE